MQNDLISRSALIEHMCRSCTSKCNLDDECCCSVDAVNNAPAVDAVKVVRCKDCEKCDHVKDAPVDGGVWICHLCRTLVHKNHFCSYGERRKDNAAD